MPKNTNWSKNPPDGAEIIEAAREMGIEPREDRPAFEIKTLNAHIKIWASGRVEGLPEFHFPSLPEFSGPVIINRIPQLIERNRRKVIAAAETGGLW